MAVANLIDDTNPAVADILIRLNKRRKRKRLTPFRLVVAVVVAIVHVVVIWHLIQIHLAAPMRAKNPPKTQLLWLLLPRNAISPDTSELDAQKMLRDAYKAVQLLPNVPHEPNPNAITLDVGEALGHALSCGAGKFEYLTPEGQRRCRSKPWGFEYDRYGYIILDTRGVAPKQPEKQRPSDAMAHERNTAPVCAKYIDPNAPCIEKILNGNNRP